MIFFLTLQHPKDEMFTPIPLIYTTFFYYGDRQEQSSLIIRQRTQASSTQKCNRLTGGTVSTTPNLWVLGNYSRFIRPGYKRVSLTGDGDINSLMGSAYISPDGKKVVAVFVNMNASVKGVKLTADDFSKTISSVKKYTTDATNSLTCDETITDPTTRITVPARSVVTFTFDLDTAAGITNIKNDASATTNAICNLNGQKVADSADKFSSLEHGVYILNGKKLIKK